MVLSLLMKGECLPENTRWAGIPAQSTLASNTYLQAPQSVVAGAIAGAAIPELS